MRLIDADALLSELNNLEVNCKNKYVKQGIDDGLHYYMPRILENEPTIDAVSVVRCRDCEHSRETDMFGERTVLICGKTDYVKLPDGYCDEGVRRDNGE